MSKGPLDVGRVHDHVGLGGVTVQSSTEVVSAKSNVEGSPHVENSSPHVENSPGIHESSGSSLIKLTANNIKPVHHLVPDHVNSKTTVPDHATLHQETDHSSTTRGPHRYDEELTSPTIHVQYPTGLVVASFALSPSRDIPRRDIGDMDPYDLDDWTTLPGQDDGFRDTQNPKKGPLEPESRAMSKDSSRTSTNSTMERQRSVCSQKSITRLASAHMLTPFLSSMCSGRSSFIPSNRNSFISNRSSFINSNRGGERHRNSTGAATDTDGCRVFQRG